MNKKSLQRYCSPQTVTVTVTDGLFLVPYSEIAALRLSLSPVRLTACSLFPTVRLQPSDCHCHQYGLFLVPYSEIAALRLSLSLSLTACSLFPTVRLQPSDCHCHQYG